ncbi:GAL3ST2 [Bugula neritina]|uniref:GAL3ST2 n=1 Tax=Bugula neritina TaxID=10212 RepID=A0A7J7JNL2_BUGNE|nr:GAL3ST2 [Bugula neritina]
MRPNKKEKADILCFHCVFSKDIANVMPEDTFFVTSVREPFAMLQSYYIYYNWYACAKKSLAEVISSLSNESWICGAPARNPMMFDLGFSVDKHSKSPKAIDEYIEMLDRRFNLVIVVEYFDESLIILRDMLGWSNDDILSFAINFRQNKKNRYVKLKPAHGVSYEDKDKIKMLLYEKSEADVKLYAHFKRKLEAIIEANKDYILKERRQLRKLRKEWMEYCIKAVVPNIYVGDNRFKTYGSNVYGYLLTQGGYTNSTCIQLAMAELPFIKLLYAYQP